MSRLIACNDLLFWALFLLVTEWNTEDEELVIRLGKNDLTPTRATVYLDVEEADVAGYAGIDAENWTEPEDTGGNVWGTEADEVTFTLDGSGTPQTIYYVYVTDQANSELYWIQRFDEPYVVDSEDFMIPVKPRINDRSLFG